VDVGVVCLRLGEVTERRGVARKLAADLIHRADQLMYGAKGQRAERVHRAAVRVANGVLVEIAEAFTIAGRSANPRARRRSR
jgi:hypothetical protein